LSRRAAKLAAGRGEVPITEALASGLTDHIWSVQELLSFRVAPPPWVVPKRRRLKTQTGPARLRPLLRLRKGVLCPTTS
jgi:hypothetical protein